MAWLDGNEKLWSDLEEKLGQEKYVFEEPGAIKKVFEEYVKFFCELPVEDVTSIKKTMEVCKNEEFLYSYVTFNYTNILDRTVNSRVSSICSEPFLHSEFLLKCVKKVHDNRINKMSEIDEYQQMQFLIILCIIKTNTTYRCRVMNDMIHKEVKVI
ncbi:MAG: hypothetical protein PUB19_07660 [Lachnospiraceae bacterium]|nr:hypothetical protein [Lachnospiraceae bacterium]